MLTASPSAESVYKHLEAGYDPPTKPSSTELDDSHRSTPIPESKLESDGDQQAHDLYLVDWDEGEAANPRNWSTFRKSWITFQLGMLALAAAAGSSIISPAQMVISRELGISEEVAVLALSLYILGFAFGPLIWAPLSEVWGRKVSMLPAMMGLALFSIGVAQSRNPQTLFICRFLSGIFGAAPVSNCTPALGDVWSPKARGMAVTFYAVAVVGGPTVAPLIGAALVVNPHLGWHWIGYILAIWVFVVTAICFFSLLETYAPYLLKKKAQRLRKTTGNDQWHHPHEELKLDINSIVTKHLARPLRMLITEPMVTCIAIWASFVYALLYLSLEVFPIVYLEHRRWSLVASTLPFLGIFMGVVFAVTINLANQPRYARALAKNNGKAVPEARLPPMIVGSWLFVIGLFWFGWTADPPTSWVPSVIAAGFIGAGFNVTFQQCINLLVDTYATYAASAVSANTFLRSLMAAGLPLAARPMFNNLGVGPAMSILGGIAALALPVPFVFMKYGCELRKRSKFVQYEE